MSLTFQILDKDLQRFHPQLNSEIWPENMVLVIGKKGVCEKDNELVFLIDEVEHNVSDWENWVSEIIDSQIIILGKTCYAKILSASFDETENSITLSLEPESDSISTFLSSGETKIRFQIGGYISQIIESFEIIKGDLESKNLDLLLVSTSNNFRNLQVFKTLELIFRDFKMTPDDKWSLLMKDYNYLYSNELRNLPVYVAGTKINSTSLIL